MKCMCAQTRPRFILSSERVFGGMEFEPMLTPREKSPLRKMKEFDLTVVCFVLGRREGEGPGASNTLTEFYLTVLCIVLGRREGEKGQEPQKPITDFFMVRRSDRRGMSSTEVKVSVRQKID